MISKIDSKLINEIDLYKIILLYDRIIIIYIIQPSISTYY